jgi:hypothetical protein
MLIGVRGDGCCFIGPGSYLTDVLPKSLMMVELSFCIGGGGNGSGDSDGSLVEAISFPQPMHFFHVSLFGRWQDKQYKISFPH